MDGSRESDRVVVPEKLSNKVEDAAVDKTAEMVEGRTLAKENSQRQNTHRAQDRARVHSALGRVRRAAEEDRGRRFTTLLHHVYNIDTLREAYLSLKRDAAPGIDGVTWGEYGEGLEDRLQDLSGRLQRGAYRARPVKRRYIPKPDGRQRPLGITTLEDKVVQMAMTMVLNQVYEVDFIGFSYGFRPGRSQHDALDAVVVGIERRRVRWVLDADISGFFDAIDHERLIELVERRISDQRVIRLPFMEYAQYPTMLAEADIVIAAIDPDDPFNHSKSAVKAMEAWAARRKLKNGYGGAAVIATQSVVYNGTVQHGRNGLLVENTTDAYYAALKELTDNQVMRENLQRTGHNDVVQRHSIQSQYRKWVSAYTQIRRL